MNKIPDYLIDSMCERIKEILDSKYTMDDINKELEEIKIMTNGVIPKKVETLTAHLFKKETPKKDTIQDYSSFTKLTSIIEGNELDDMEYDEVVDLLKNVAKSYYDFKMKKMRG